MTCPKTTSFRFTKAFADLFLLIYYLQCVLYGNKMLFSGLEKYKRLPYNENYP